MSGLVVTGSEDFSESGFERGVNNEGLVNAVIAEVRVSTNEYGEQLVIHYQIEETHPNGERKDVQAFFSYGAGCLGTEERPTKLRKMINDITGKKLPQEVAEAGFDLGKLVGVPCQLVVKNTFSKKGNLYTKIESFLKPGAEKLEIVNYKSFAERTSKSATRKSAAPTPTPEQRAGTANYSDASDEDLPWS